MLTAVFDASRWLRDVLLGRRVTETSTDKATQCATLQSETSLKPLHAEAASEGAERPKVYRAWEPLRIQAYRRFWIAGLFSNLGTWIHEAGAQWQMTTLDPDPNMVSAVRTCMAIPVFLLALPAGVWADQFDRRKWLMGTQWALLVIALAMALLSWMGALTPVALLVLTSAMGVAMIMNIPAWQALTPTLVPAGMVPTAVQAGSVSFNLARSVGPALAGWMIYQFGTASAFAFNGLSFLGMLGVLLFWRPNSASDAGEKNGAASDRATGRFLSELAAGLKLVWKRETLRNVLLRVFIFAVPASVLWSLLSLVATQRLGFSELGFGVSLAMIGVGAVAGSTFLPALRARFSSGAILLTAQLIFAGLCGVIGMSNWRLLVLPALFVLGISWMTTMTTLNATAQVHLPSSFRARGMASYMMFFAAGMSLGPFFWGKAAEVFGLGEAFLIAGGIMALQSVACLKLSIGSLR